MHLESLCLNVSALKMSIDLNKLNSALDAILGSYKATFSEKVYSDENDDHDVLMDVFGISPLLKRESRQYWGRELGMCWQKLVV